MGITVLPGLLLATLLVCIDWGNHLWAMAANRNITLLVRLQLDRIQDVVLSGPCQYVRHPGCLVGLILTVCAGPFLGSY